MAHLLLTSMIFVFPLILAVEVEGRSPDRVPHSPIPPLRLAEQLRAGRALYQQRPRAVAQDNAAANSEASMPLTPTDIWDSYEMQNARRAVLRFGRLSAQTSVAESEQFLDRLSQLTPVEMEDWLRRFQARQESIAYGRRTRELARRSNIESLVQRTQTQRQRAASFADLQSDVPLLASVQQDARNRIASKPFSDRNLVAASGLRYNPFELVFDPASPRGLRRLAAAAVVFPIGVDPIPEVEAPVVAAAE